MRLLLPPSETKRDGGEPGSSLELSGLRFPELTAVRSEVLAAVTRLARNRVAMMGALGLGPTQLFEVDRNRSVRTSPTMPAISRYTGVLYDALDSPSLGQAARDWVSRSVLIHSALFGLIGADDRIPAYRLSHDSRLPGLSLKKVWRAPLTAVLETAEFSGAAGARDSSRLTLDLRSEAYVALGPLPTGGQHFYLRVVSQTASGQKKALTHFNKKGKGEFVRALALSGLDHPHVDSLLAWATASGILLALGAPGELELSV